MNKPHSKDIAIISLSLSTFISLVGASSTHPVSSKNHLLQTTLAISFALLFSYLTVVLYLASTGKRKCSMRSSMSTSLITCALVGCMTFASPIQTDSAVFRQVGPGHISELKHLHQTDWSITLKSNNGTDTFVCTKAAILAHHLDVGVSVSGLYYQKRFVDLVANGKRVVNLSQSVKSMENQRSIVLWGSILTAIGLVIHAIYEFFLREHPMEGNAISVEHVVTPEENE